MTAMMLLGAATMTAVLGQVAEAPAARANSRRVPISLSFSGHEVFVTAHAAAGTQSAITVMEGPAQGSARLMRKGRRVLFWMGVRQYELEHAPRLYLVNLHCPVCNGMAGCTHQPAEQALQTMLEGTGLRVGPEAVAAQVGVSVLDGQLEAGEAAFLIDGYWKLQERRGLYGVRQNAIRITQRGMLYQVFHLPTAAPEGKYRVVTYFLDGHNVIAATESSLFVRQAGLANWLSRMAERRATTYGIMTVAIALVTGILAGLIFRRSAKH